MLAVYFSASIPIFKHEGLKIYTTNAWIASENPNKEFYGVLAAIYGSVYTSVLAVLIALPLSVSFAVFVIDYAPSRIKEPLIVATDIMAGLPTIIYGIYLSAGVLLGIMVTPFASAIIREAYRALPFMYREAVYSVGATRYEATKLLIKQIKPAIVAGLLLAFGRAIGETVAVSLVIGNTFNISPSLFAPGYTISSLIANQFGNAFIYKYMVPALFAAGLSLFFIGLAANVLGILILRRYGYGR